MSMDPSASKVTLTSGAPGASKVTLTSGAPIKKGAEIFISYGERPNEVRRAAASNPRASADPNPHPHPNAHPNPNPNPGATRLGLGWGERLGEGED